ncbi:MAG: DNA polymerase III subunit delta' [Steroidobacteraceae bacterium]
MTEANTGLPPSPERLPWHDSAVTQLEAAWANSHLPHALLMQGADGLGKKSLAAWLACAVLCERSTTTLQHCGACTNCKLTSAGSHPDFLWIEPEEDKQQISVDQIRAATERLSKTSYMHGYKIAVVTPAHQMTHNAANSLLKTLEEPPANSLLILLTSRPSSLPATVRSRCQRIVVQRPTRDTALAWLQQKSGGTVTPQLLEFAGGAPLRALEVNTGGAFEDLDQRMTKSLAALLKGETDVTQVAGEWGGKDIPIADRLTWLDLWLTSQARAAIAGTADLVTFPTRPAHLPSLGHMLNISAVYSMVDRLRALKAQLTRTSLQRELAIESWLVALLDILAPPRALTHESRSTR